MWFRQTNWIIASNKLNLVPQSTSDPSKNICLLLNLDTEIDLTNWLDHHLIITGHLICGNKQSVLYYLMFGLLWQKDEGLCGTHCLWLQCSIWQLKSMRNREAEQLYIFPISWQRRKNDHEDLGGHSICLVQVLGKTHLVLSVCTEYHCSSIYYFSRSDPRVEVVVHLPHSIVGILALFVQLYQINEHEGHVSFAYQFIFSTPFLHQR